MIFSENRYPLFRIMLWKRCILQRFARQRKPLSARESPLRGRGGSFAQRFAPAQKSRGRCRGFNECRDQYFATAGPPKVTSGRHAEWPL